MDQWDPMKEAFENRNFNCYNQGVGRDLMGSSRHNKGVSLYVQNIPPSLGKNGFQNLFAEYGKLTHHKLIPSDADDLRGSHGYVTYENLLDAEMAISHLDKMKLGKFTLRVAPALTEEEKDRRRRLKQDEEMNHSYIRRDASARANNNSSSSSFSSYQHMEDRSRPHMNESSSQFQNSGLRQGGSWYQESRHVGVGRGSIFRGMERDDVGHHSLNSMEHEAHSHYASPESLAYQKQVSHGYQNSSEQGRYKEVDDIDLAYHKRHLLHDYQNVAAQEHYKEVDDHDFVRKPFVVTPPKQLKSRGICVYCYREGCVNKCSNCKVFYCSSVCQRLDWPNHMDICNTLGFEYYKRDVNPSSIPHGNVDWLQNSNVCFDDDDDDDIESNNSKLTTVQMTHRSDRSHGSDNAMFPTNGQEMRHFKEYRREEPSTSAGHVNRSLNTAKAQNETGGMIKGTVSKTESVRGQKTKPTFTNDHGNSKIGKSNSYNLRNIQSSHERNTHRYQDERATTQVSQKFSNSASSRNSRSFETKEAPSKTQARPVGSSSETRVKDTGASVKIKCEKSVDKESTSLIKQEQNIKSQEGRNSGIKKAAVEAKEKLPSAVELTVAIKTSGLCCLTYFESPYKFWISLQDYLELFTEHTQQMGKEISESSNTTQVACKVGGTYGVMYLGEWCRVTVISIKDREITVFFIDFGNQVTVKPEDLRLLSMEMLELPAQAVCCCISKLKPKGSDSWSEEASSAVQKWLGHPMSQFMQFEVVAKRGSVHAVNISLKNKTMSDVLLAGGFAEKVDSEPGLPNLTSNSESSRPMSSSLPSRMDIIKIGDQVTGEFMNFTSSDRFIVVDVASTQLMDKLSSALLSEYKNSTVPYKPVQGELVAAQFSGDKAWYRAEIINIDGEDCTLYFVDYGNSEVQKAGNIRRVTNKLFTETPKQALVCDLFTEQPLSRYDSKIVNQEIQKLLGSATCLSLLVRGKTDEALLVDVIDTSGQSLSVELIRKLSKMSIETQNTNSNRLVKKGVTKDNRLPSSTSSSKTVPEKIATLADLGTETLPVESGKTVSVLVSVVKSPMEFYVRLNSKNGSFITMMKELEKSVISCPRLSVPSVGSLAAAQFSQNRVWSRVVVEKIEGKKCLVRFFDYGNSEETSLLTLKVLPELACHLPAQAIRCCLDGRLQNLSNASILKFNKIMEESSVEIRVCKNDFGVFSVQVFQDDVDIGAFLADSCSQHTPTVEPITVVKQPTATSDILMETLPATGEPVKAVVTHIDSFSRMFLACNVVTEVMIQLYKSADSLPSLRNPVVDSVCAAKYSQDNTWYRARIVGIKSPKTCIVQFLDYGNSEETSMSNLRELDPDLCKLPGQAICCCLFGHEQELDLAASHRPSSSDAELINKLRLELLEKSVTVRVVNRKSDTWIVKLENEHGECMNTKYKVAWPAEVKATPKLADLTFEYPSETEFEACFLHINSLSDFYCQIFNLELLAELDSLSERLREDVSTLVGDVHLNPVINGVYASKFMDTWYRCVVEEVRNTKVFIKYIDYGNSEEILASELRPLSPERLQMPVRLLRCKLYGVAPVQENWTNPEIQDYLEVLRQSRVHLAVETRGIEVFHVSVFILQGNERVSVAADLVDMGLAKFLPVVSSQKDESRCLLPDPEKHQQSADEQDDDDDNIDEEMELQRKIQELEMQLKLSKQKKKHK